MAKFQWTAASETVGQAPALLNAMYTADGQSLSHWEIVEDATADGGQAIKLVGGASLRHRLVIPGATADNTKRIDMRGRFHQPSDSSSAQGLHFASFLIKGSGSSDSYNYYAYWGTSGAVQLNTYRTSPNNEGQQTVATEKRIGWWNFRMTYQPSGSSPRVRLALWKDGDGTESSPLVEVTTDTYRTNVDGTAVGFGGFTPGDFAINWITVGTDTDDADVAPSSVSVPVSFSGPVPNQNTSEGAAFSLQLAPYFSGTESRTYSVQAGTLPAGLTLNSTTGEISGSASTPGTFSGLVIRATDADENTADTNAFSITVSALTKEVRVRLYDGSTPAASVTGLSVAWFDDPDVSTLGAPAAQFADQSTDADGWMDVPLTGYTSLPIDGEGLLIVQKPNSTAEADLYFIGRQVVSAG